MSDPQRTAGITEGQLALPGPRFKSYAAMLQTNNTSMVSAYSAAETSTYSEVLVTNGRARYPTTLCVHIEQLSIPDTGTAQFRISGLDMFGNAIVEETPLISVVAKAQIWIYCAKVFSNVLKFEYKNTGLTDIELSLGQRFDWAQTIDATNDHVAGENLGIGIPMLVKYWPPGDVPAVGRHRRSREGLRPDRLFATDTLTATVIADTNTVVIDGITYTFRATPVAIYNVQLGGSLAASLQNLYDAINHTGTPGTQYFSTTTAHPTVTARQVTGTTLTVAARRSGSEANSISLTETVTGSWGTPTLVGGMGDDAEILGVVVHEFSATGGSGKIDRTNFTIGVTADGWSGTIEKLSIRPGTTVGTYVTGDTALFTVSLMTAAVGFS